MIDSGGDIFIFGFKRGEVSREDIVRPIQSMRCLARSARRAAPTASSSVERWGCCERMRARRDGVREEVKMRICRAGGRGREGCVSRGRARERWIERGV
jgi:hypothetical protein